jgi:hypothetical protein
MEFHLHEILSDYLQNFIFEGVLVVIVGFLGVVYLFCWSPELGIRFLHFPVNLVLNYCFAENGFYPFFVFPLLHLVLCSYVLDRLVGGFSHLFSFPWFNFVLWLFWVCR